MRRALVNLAFLIAVSCAGPAKNPDAPAKAHPSFGRLVLLDPTLGEGIDASLKVTINERAAAALRPVVQDGVMTLEQIRQGVKADLAEQLAGCSETACFAELGSALGARFVLATDVSQLGRYAVIGYRLIDTERAQVLGRHVERAQVDSWTAAELEKVVDAGIKQLVDGLSE